MRKFLIILFLTGFIIPQSAFAYLDPGTGSMVAQIIIASAVGAICTCKMLIGKLLHPFKKDDDDK